MQIERILLAQMRQALLATIKDFSKLPEGVWKRTGALNTWGTNAIEGNTLTQADVERLLLEEKSVAGRPVPDVVETLQHEIAFRGLVWRRTHPIDLVTAQQLHEEVFRGIPAYRPGQWRLTNPHIGGTKYRPPRREKVVTRLESWIRDYDRRVRTKEDVFQLAARFHHEFEAIHPFENGNGRVGRLLLNLHFLKHDWPPVHILPGDRKEYWTALEAGHAGDYNPLTRLLAGAASRSLLDLLDQVGGPEDQLHTLARFQRRPWNPYPAHYLALRARQGPLAAIHVTESSAPATAKQGPGRPRWLTSERALKHYIERRARKEARERIAKTSGRQGPVPGRLRRTRGPL